MHYTKYTIFGILLLAIGIGCAIYGYIAYAEKSRGTFVKMGKKAGFISAQENIDLLRKMESDYPEAKTFREAAEREENRRQRIRRRKIAFSILACLAFASTGSVVLVIRG